MAERKPFLLRLEPGLHTALQRWAADDLRSLNAQIEYLLRQSLLAAGRGRHEPAPVESELPSDDGSSIE
ncbi:MAG: hypothetical protein ABJC19_08130 [Gemmatimonadota bacterium]